MLRKTVGTRAEVHSDRCERAIILHPLGWGKNLIFVHILGTNQDNMQSLVELSVGVRGTFMCFLMIDLNFGHDLDL